MRLIAPDGTITDITYELQAERSSLGDCTGFVGVFSDVSTLRRLERDRMALERQRRSVPGLALLSKRTRLTTALVTDREEAEQNRQLQEHFIDVT